jgi:hypothetical protein
LCEESVVGAVEFVDCVAGLGVDWGAEGVVDVAVGADFLRGGVSRCLEWIAVEFL